MNNTWDAMSRQKPYLWIISIVVMLSLIVDPLRRFYDDELRLRPWISAGVEILPDTGEGVHVRYDVRANLAVRGTWTAWLEVDGRQRCFGQGRGSYSPVTRRNRIWPLTEWLNVACAVPVVPFRTCVAYQVATSSGAEAGFGPYCSEVYDPRGVTQ